MPPGAPYRLGKAPAGFSRAETLALAALWYLNPPSAGRLGYFGSFDLDVLDFYRAPLKRSIETFVKSRDPQFVVRSLQRGSVDYVVTMDAPPMWNSLPLVSEEHRFFEDVVRVYQVRDPWPVARFETRDGELDAGSPRVISRTDGRIVVFAEAPHSSRLVVAVANDRGFRADVDGVQSKTQDNDLGFLTVPLTEGPHTVVFEYRPPLLGAGALVSGAALAAAIFLDLRARR